MFIILCMRYYMLGPFIAIQLSGIPIGGPCSTIWLAIALGYCEHRYCLYVWPKIAARLGLNARFRSSVAVTRYVDDYLAISGIFCKRCLKQIMDSIYIGFITFEPDEEQMVNMDMVSFKFLDMFLCLSFNSSQIAATSTLVP